MKEDTISIADELRRANRVRSPRRQGLGKLALALAALAASLASALALHGLFATTSIKIGIGTQNTTTNTVTGGIVLRQLGLLEKNLPRAGKYARVKYTLDWQNSTSGPPITNGMMADNIQIGMMGDYPLLVNGATGQQTQNETRLIAIIAYNAYGGGNGVVVPVASPYYDLADLKGKRVSVPFGSAAHGMLLRAMQLRGLPDDYWTLVSQSPEIGSTNLQERRIDAHADFVPFAELLPFRGSARKIYDGAETRHPTFHGVVIRKDFGEKYPEIVVAYIKSLLEANAWVRRDPRAAAVSVQRWTGVNKEVAYMFLGPGGVHTLDPTIKAQWLAALRVDYDVLKQMHRIAALDLTRWVDDRYLRSAYRELGLDYEAQRRSFSGYPVTGHDPICGASVGSSSDVGQIWLADGDIIPFSSTRCTLAGVRHFRDEGKQFSAVYVNDRALGAKLFADAAFYALGSGSEITPFLSKRDAEQFAKQHGGRVATYQEALEAVTLALR